MPICPASAFALLFAAGLLACGPAFAAHPLQTEDTGTQGAGNIEWENGLSRSRAGAVHTFAYQPQFSYGLTPSLDLILQPSWLAERAASGARASGLGDTNLDAKWRFFGEAPFSLGTRAGLTLPTSQHGLGLPHGDVAEHATLVGTYDAVPFTVHANLGLTKNPQGSGLRRWSGLASTAVMWAATESLTLTGEATTGPDLDALHGIWWRAYLAGTIYTIRPGLDLDFGLQYLTRSTQPGRNWLLGLTYRFAL